jgi:hypothetical protein
MTSEIGAEEESFVIEAKNTFERAVPFDHCWSVAMEFAEVAVRQCREAANELTEGFSSFSPTTKDDPTVLSVAKSYMLTFSQLGLVGP